MAILWPMTYICIDELKIYQMSIVDDFNEYRSRMNERIMAADNKVIKRIYNLDTNTYAEGALDTKTKEAIGLACSMVLRCDDCVRYHIGKCKELGYSKDQMFEIFAIANLIGGTIVIPHLRRAVEYWEALEEEENKND
jgi:AhpD family alkylhydroperoxidase